MSLRYPGPDFPSALFDDWLTDAPDDGVEPGDDAEFEVDHDGANDDEWLRERGYGV